MVPGTRTRKVKRVGFRTVDDDLTLLRFSTSSGVTSDMSDASLGFEDLFILSLSFFSNFCSFAVLIRLEGGAPSFPSSKARFLVEYTQHDSDEKVIGAYRSEKSGVASPIRSLAPFQVAPDRACIPEQGLKDDEPSE